MAQIASEGRPLTVSLSPPDSATWLTIVESNGALDAQGDSVDWLIYRTGAPYQVVAPFQVYGLTRDGDILEGPVYGLADIVSDPSDAHTVTPVRVMAHIPEVIAYWIVPAGIVGAPDVRVRTVNTRSSI
jgi:hypothetical protein